MSAGEAAAKTAVPYIIGAGVLGLGGWWLYNKAGDILPDAFKDVADALTNAKEAVTDAVEAVEDKVRSERLDAFNKMDAVVPNSQVKYVDYIEAMPTGIKEMVEVGNLLTPDVVLVASTQAGADTGNYFTQTRDSLRPEEIEAYNAMSTTERLLFNIQGSIEDDPLDVLKTTGDTLLKYNPLTAIPYYGANLISDWW